MEDFPKVECPEIWLEKKWWAWIYSIKGQVLSHISNTGVNHYAEEYFGTYGDKIGSDDARALNDMFSFFDAGLKFEEWNLNPNRIKKLKK